MRVDANAFPVTSVSVRVGHLTCPRGEQLILCITGFVTYSEGSVSSNMLLTSVLSQGCSTCSYASNWKQLALQLNWHHVVVRTCILTYIVPPWRCVFGWSFQVGSQWRGPERGSHCAPQLFWTAAACGRGDVRKRSSGATNTWLECPITSF